MARTAGRVGARRRYTRGPAAARGAQALAPVRSRGLRPAPGRNVRGHRPCRRQPGRAARRACGAAYARCGMEVVGDIELFAQALPERRARIIAVTGTNGKSTVASLAGAMARAAGVDCEVAGNIGPPVLDALMRREDAGRAAGLWVLEVSSFQLAVTASLAAHAAAVLNVTEDHLDRYRGFDDYARATARVFSGDGMQVLNRDDPRSLAMALPGRKTSTFGLDAP